MLVQLEKSMPCRSSHDGSSHVCLLLFAPPVCAVHPAQVMHLDVSDLESVRAFARVFEEKHGGQLDVLVNNGEWY